MDMSHFHIFKNASGSIWNLFQTWTAQHLNSTHIQNTSEKEVQILVVAT